MKTVGVMPGKFLPFHRGHLAAILKAGTMCDKLYVIVCEDEEETKELCKGGKFISLKERSKWVSQELKDMPYIKVVTLNQTERGIATFPNGWKDWADAVMDVVPEPIDIIFGNEESYRENHEKFFPQSIKYVTFDADRAEFQISGTQIRENPIKHWDMLSGASRPFFAKKILITGTESCGKSSLTRALAKYFYTSWSEEVGRYYSERYLGGREDGFEMSDFDRIGWLQYEQDLEAMRTANKIVFFDTDALITNFYAIQYLGRSSKFLLDFSKLQEYDLIIAMTPEVEWVDDGLRWISEQEKRNMNHQIILDMYKIHKPGVPIVEIGGGSYQERYDQAIQISKEIING